MDELLRQRLVGALALVFLALLLVSLLPKAEDEAAPDTASVVVNLDGSPVAPPPATGGTLAADGEAGGDAPEGAALMPDRAPAPVAVDADSDELIAPEGEPDGEVVLAVAAPTSTPKPTPKPTATPVPQARPTPTPVPTSQAKAPVDAPEWWVQVGSFSQIENARRVERQLQQLGQKTMITPVASSKGTLYRVRAGPYSRASDAEQGQRVIVRNGYRDARVIAP